jgi:pyruvate dehydrogenase E1 component beta subunit
MFVETMPMLWTPGEAPERGVSIPLGKAKIVREGSDVTVISYGPQVGAAVKVAETVAKDGISVEVIDLRTISPLDMDAILGSVSKTGAAVILHEAIRNFGPGGEISSRIHEKLFDKLKGPVARIGGKFAPVPFSKPLEDAFLPSAEDLEAAVRSLAARPAVPA